MNQPAAENPAVRLESVYLLWSGEEECYPSYLENRFQAYDPMWWDAAEEALRDYYEDRYDGDLEAATRDLYDYDQLRLASWRRREWVMVACRAFAVLAVQAEDGTWKQELVEERAHLMESDDPDRFRWERAEEDTLHRLGRRMLARGIEAEAWVRLAFDAERERGGWFPGS